MKKIIAIVLLCWSAGVMAEEKVWYCTSQIGVALADDNLSGHWTLGRLKVQRITVKQESQRQITIVNSATPMFPDNFNNCYPHANYPEVIFCHGGFRNFILNTETGYATYASLAGATIRTPYTSWFQIDALAYKCESF